MVLLKSIVKPTENAIEFYPLDRLPRFVAQNTLWNQNPVKDSGDNLKVNTR